MSEEHSGSWRSSGSKFQAVRPGTKKRLTTVCAKMIVWCENFWLNADNSDKRHQMLVCNSPNSVLS